MPDHIFVDRRKHPLIFHKLALESNVFSGLCIIFSNNRIKRVFCALHGRGRWVYVPTMLRHKDLWNTIDQLARVNGYSASGLAKKAGLDPTSFNKSKRISADGKARWPSTESISKILAATDTTMSEFLALMGEDAVPAPAAKKEEKAAQAPVPAPAPTAAAYKIPLIQDIHAISPDVFNGEGGLIRDDSTTYFTLPDVRMQISDDAWAMVITGSSFAPYFQEGDIMLVDPHGPARAGDPFLIRRRSEEKLAVYRGQSAQPVVGEALGRIMCVYYALVQDENRDVV